MTDTQKNAAVEAVGWIGSGSFMALQDGREGFIWPTPAAAHPIALYAAPQPAPVTGGEDAGVSELYAMLAAAFNEEARLRYALLKIADGVEKRAHDGSTFIDDHPDAMEIARAAIAALSPSAPEAPSEREKLIAELVKGLSACVEYMRNHRTEHSEPYPLAPAEALITRARKIGGAS